MLASGFLKGFLSTGALRVAGLLPGMVESLAFLQLGGLGADSTFEDLLESDDSRSLESFKKSFGGIWGGAVAVCC